MKLVNKTSQNIIANKLHIAEKFMDRLIGLMGKKSLSDDECLWIKKCNNIHTHFMCFPIDVIYLDKNQQVVSIKKKVPPWRFTLPVLKADSVIEFKSQDLSQKLSIGDKVDVDT